MTTEHNDPAWDSLSYAEKNRVLFERQKKMLEEFLERGAISQQQYCGRSINFILFTSPGSYHLYFPKSTFFQFWEI